MTEGFPVSPIKGTLSQFMCLKILDPNKRAGYKVKHQATSSSFNFSIRERTGFNSVMVIYTMGVSLSATLSAVSKSCPLILRLRQLFQKIGKCQQFDLNFVP